MHGCELVLTPEAAEQTHDEVRAKLGYHPCEQGQRCPLLPRDLSSALHGTTSVRMQMGVIALAPILKGLGAA